MRGFGFEPEHHAICIREKRDGPLPLKLSGDVGRIFRRPVSYRPRCFGGGRDLRDAAQFGAEVIEAE